MNKTRLLSSLTLVSAIGISQAALLVNGTFDDDSTSPAYPRAAPAGGSVATSNSFGDILQGDVDGWSTTASDGQIEIWSSGFTANGRQFLTANGPTALTSGGDYFAELNANEVSTLFQDVTTPTAIPLSYSFLHTGRAGADTMRFQIFGVGVDNTIGTADDVSLFSREVTTDNIEDPGEYNGWAQYFGSNVLTTTAGGTYRFAFEAVSSGNNNNEQGNFIDSAIFGNVAVPEPSSLSLAAFASLALLGRRRR